MALLIEDKKQIVAEVSEVASVRLQPLLLTIKV